MSLLRDLNSLVESIITAVDPESEGAFHRFDVAFQFLGSFTEVHGADVERATLETLVGGTRNSRAQELGRILERNLVGTVTAAQKLLGEAWTRPREQGQGQPAFEVKPPSPSKEPKVFNDALANCLSMLTVSLRVSPVFLVHLPAENGMQREKDTILRRAVDSATSALGDEEVEVVRSAVQFLKAFVS